MAVCLCLQTSLIICLSRFVAGDEHGMMALGSNSQSQPPISCQLIKHHQSRSTCRGMEWSELMGTHSLPLHTLKKRAFPIIVSRRIIYGNKENSHHKTFQMLDCHEMYWKSISFPRISDTQLSTFLSNRIMMGELPTAESTRRNINIYLFVIYRCLIVNIKYW